MHVWKRPKKTHSSSVAWRMRENVRERTAATKDVIIPPQPFKVSPIQCVAKNDNSRGPFKCPAPKTWEYLRYPFLSQHNSGWADLLGNRPCTNGTGTRFTTYCCSSNMFHSFALFSFIFYVNVISLIVHSWFLFVVFMSVHFIRMHFHVYDPRSCIFNPMSVKGMVDTKGAAFTLIRSKRERICIANTVRNICLYRLQRWVCKAQSVVLFLYNSAGNGPPTCLPAKESYAWSSIKKGVPQRGFASWILQTRCRLHTCTQKKKSTKCMDVFEMCSLDQRRRNSPKCHHELLPHQAFCENRFFFPNPLSCVNIISTDFLPNNTDSFTQILFFATLSSTVGIGHRRPPHEHFHLHGPFFIYFEPCRNPVKAMIRILYWGNCLLFGIRTVHFF